MGSEMCIRDRLKFAGDIKIFREIKTSQDIHLMQEDQNTGTLVKWSKDRQMTFNIDKCKKCTSVTAITRKQTTLWKARS